MFEVGFTEMILIVGLALIVLGPQRLPGLVRKVGRWAGRARSMARQLQMQLDHEITLDELSKTRPMQAGPPPAQQAPGDESNTHDVAAADAQAPQPVDSIAEPEPSLHAATVTDPVRPVDISKSLQ